MNEFEKNIDLFRIEKELSEIINDINLVKKYIEKTISVLPPEQKEEIVRELVKFYEKNKTE